MELSLDVSEKPFSLEHTLRCGQVFGWRQRGEWWVGVVNNQPVAVLANGNVVKVRCEHASMSDEVFNYFGLGDNLESILTSVAKDPLIVEAARQWYGLRICRQNPWECLATYLCSIDSNISKIELCLSRLRQRFGRRLLLGDEELFTFPTADALSKASEADLTACALGFRTRYIMQASRRVASGEIILEEVSKLSYSEAIQVLIGDEKGTKNLLGVGPKVADCVLLFSMGKLEAVPLDVWMRRLVARSYRHLFEAEQYGRLLRRLEEGTITLRGYRIVSEAMRRYFGPYAGYAQEYLFQHIRYLKGSVADARKDT